MTQVFFIHLSFFCCLATAGSVRPQQENLAGHLRQEFSITQRSEPSLYRLRSNQYITDTSEAPGICFYPNPVTQKKLYLNSGALPVGDYMIRIFTVGGQPVMEQKIRQPEKETEHLIRLPASTRAGYYSLRIEGANYSQRMTFAVK